MQRMQTALRLLLFGAMMLALIGGVSTFISRVGTVRAAAVTGLHVSNNQLLDSANRVFLPHGVNRAGGEYMCDATSSTTVFDGPVDATAINALLSWDINIVRIPLNEDCWLGINGYPAAQYTAAQYQQAVVNFVNLLNANNIVAILDLHWAAPGTTQANKQLAMPDLDHAPAFWTSVATTFKGNSSVIFDLFNEPFTTSWSCWLNGSTAASASPCTDVPFAVAGMQKLVTTVRATGATNPLLLGSLAYSNDMSQWLQNKPVDPDNSLIAALHIYNFNLCDTLSCLNAQVAPVAAQVPVLVGEMGENDCAHSFIDAMMNWFDTHGIGYLGWAWNTYDCSNFPALVSSYTGTPTAYGVGLHDHLLSLAAIGGPPPAVSLTSPTTGQAFTSSSTVTLTATATAHNNKTITKVEFYSGSTLLGTATTSPYSFSWTNVAANSYILTAKAYDSGGGSTISAPVAITVNAPGSTVIGCKVQYTMGQWSTGFSVGINITNTGTTAISGWTLTFSFSGNQQITQNWNGVLTQTGENISIKDAGYNANIAVGNYTGLGFNGAYSGVNNSPTIFFLNNQACTVA